MSVCELVGTHIPVLLAVAQVWPVTTVLELGAGLISSPTFLDRRVFPDLQRLESWENQRMWWAQVKAAVDHDPRADVRLFDDIWLSLPLRDADLAQYDLIFIDDGRDLAERAATIREVAPRVSEQTLVVVHDFENVAYQEALGELQRFVFDALVPHTGVGWRGEQPRCAKFQALNRRVRSVWLEAMSLETWLRVLA